MIMDWHPGFLPNDIEALKSALLAQTARAAQSEAELAVATAKICDDQALIARQQIHIEKLTRELHGPRSQAARTQTFPRTSAARTRAGAGTGGMLVLLRRRPAGKLGEDITETLEVVPRRWKVIQHVREKFSCRDCEISQAAAPFHVIARGWAGPALLAMILFEKFGQHQPLNRQAERYTREGVPLSLSTLAD